MPTALKKIVCAPDIITSHTETNGKTLMIKEDATEKITDFVYSAGGYWMRMLTKDIGFVSFAELLGG